MENSNTDRLISLYKEQFIKFLDNYTEYPSVRIQCNEKLIRYTEDKISLEDDRNIRRKLRKQMDSRINLLKNQIASYKSLIEEIEKIKSIFKDVGVAPTSDCDVAYAVYLLTRFVIAMKQANDKKKKLETKNLVQKVPVIKFERSATMSDSVIDELKSRIDNIIYLAINPELIDYELKNAGVITRSYSEEFIKIACEESKKYSKKSRINIGIYFDENGEPNRETYQKYPKYLCGIIDKHVTSIDVNDIINPDAYLALYVDEELIKDIEEEKRLQKEKEEQEKEAKRLEAEKAKELRNLDTGIVTQTIINNANKENPQVVEIFSKYLNRDFSLKRNTIHLISCEELIDKIQSIDSFCTKKTLSLIVKEYKKELIKERIINIIKLFDSNEKKKIKLLLEVNKDALLEDLYKLVTSENFVNNNISALKEELADLLEEYDTKEETKQIHSLIVFLEDDRCDEELTTIDNTPTSQDKGTILRSIHKKFDNLQSIQYEEIIKGHEDNFHVMKYGNGDFTIGKSIKAYRYGRGKSKVCLFRLSICDQNIAILKDYYKLNCKPAIILTYGFGNVEVEDENALYSRENKYASDNYQKVIEIAEIFATPFTDETFNKAKELIDNGFIQINKILDKANSYGTDSNDNLRK